MKNRKLFNILERQVCYFCIFLFLLNHWGFSQSKNVVQPIIGVAPLWIMAEYGLYWGVSLSGGIEILKHHNVLASADLAPVGLLGMDDVDTEGKEQHWGGTLSYLFTIRLCDNFVRFEPGAALGLSSIPYIYGTFLPSYNDSTLSTNSTSNERPERETLWGVGPEFRFSIGRNRLQIFLDGRVLFAKNYNTALMTNAGVSFEL